MKKIVLSLLCSAALVSSLYAECTYTQKESLEVGFKAYKTPLKIGVGGKFNSVKYTAQKLSATDLKSLLVNAQAVVDTASVNTNNALRDKKLVTFFFDMMKEKQINAKITAVNIDEKSKDLSGVIDLDITMNGVTHPAQMKFFLEKNILHADGVIDLADYDALGALASINKACYDLHKGKTWSDVSIGFIIPMTSTCK